MDHILMVVSFLMVGNQSKSHKVVQEKISTVRTTMKWIVVSVSLLVVVSTEASKTDFTPFNYTEVSTHKHCKSSAILELKASRRTTKSIVRHRAHVFIRNTWWDHLTQRNDQTNELNRIQEKRIQIKNTHNIPRNKCLSSDL